MEAKVERDGDILTVHLIGRLNYESADPFRETCFTNFLEQKVIFNFKDLGFVGSSGIASFVDIVCEFSRRNSQGIKLCHVGSEFRRIFEANSEGTIYIYEDQQKAKLAYQGYPIKAINETPSFEERAFIANPEITEEIIEPAEGQKPEVNEFENLAPSSSSDSSEVDGGLTSQ